MTTPASKPEAHVIDASDLTVGVISARWNHAIVERLHAGAIAAASARSAMVVDETAPGAFELPFAARVLARSGAVDALVVLGAVIRGETTHYELVSEGCATGVMSVQLDSGVPIGFGVVTVEDHEQAMARSGADHNVGADAMCAALEMARLAARW